MMAEVLNDQGGLANPEAFYRAMCERRSDATCIVSHGRSSFRNG